MHILHLSVEVTHAWYPKPPELVLYANIGAHALRDYESRGTVLVDGSARPLALENAQAQRIASAIERTGMLAGEPDLDGVTDTSDAISGLFVRAAVDDAHGQLRGSAMSSGVRGRDAAAMRELVALLQAAFGAGDRFGPFLHPPSTYPQPAPMQVALELLSGGEPELFLVLASDGQNAHGTFATPEAERPLTPDPRSAWALANRLVDTPDDLELVSAEHATHQLGVRGLVGKRTFEARAEVSERGIEGRGGPALREMLSVLFAMAGLSEHFLLRIPA